MDAVTFIRSSEMDLASEKALLLQRDAEWAIAASEGRDVERVLSYWTDDAVVFPPDLPAVVGKAALRQYVQASMQMPGFRITWTSTDVTFSPDRNFAYMFSSNSIDMNAPNGTPMRTEGRAVTIWRREPDGEWRCAVDIWNAPPAAPQIVGPKRG
jgi:ketosteroid isomerase-like protein